MRTFLSVLYRSLVDPIWLKVQSNFLGVAFRYFFLLSVVIVALLVVPTLVTLPGEWKHLQQTTIDTVPPFKAELKKGVLTVTGLAQPWQWQTDRFGLLVDTVTTSTLASADIINRLGWPAGVLITRGQFEVFNQDTGQDDIRSWTRMPDFVIAKQDVLDMFNRVNSSTGLKVGFGIVLLVVSYLAFVLVKLFSLVVLAALVLLIARIGHKQYTFKQIYTLGLYTVIVPVAITVLSGLLPITIPYLFSAVWVAWLLAIVFTKDGVGEEVVKIGL